MFGQTLKLSANVPLFFDRHCEERSDEAIQLDGHGALRAPRHDKSLEATGLCYLIALLCLLPLSAAAAQPESASLRILSEKTFSTFRADDADEPCVRFSPSVALANGGERRIVVPTDRNDAAVFVELRILDASEGEVRVRKCEARAPEQAGVEVVEPAEEKLIHLYTAFDVYVRSPGRYTAVVSLAVGEKPDQRKYHWVESAKFAFEVQQ
jgi:hypothetical protein